VASVSLNGIARIQQNGVWSNALGFIVTVAGGNTVTPSMLNMVVGDTHTIQALSASGQPVTGLTWASSNLSVVSLSTDNPPILTAVAVGHATITAGSGSADVTVSATAFAPGTVLWSNPGDGSGVTSIVPAVPSATGVADIFAFQNDGTVQAITADGTTAWTADVSQATKVLADFLGGLLAVNANGSGPGSIQRLDGITGQADFVYSPSGANLTGDVAVHTDGTTFAIVSTGSLPVLQNSTHPRARVECAKKQKARALSVGPWEPLAGLRAGHVRLGLRAGRASLSGDQPAWTTSRPGVRRRRTWRNLSQSDCEAADGHLGEQIPAWRSGRNARRDSIRRTRRPRERARARRRSPSAFGSRRGSRSASPGDPPAPPAATTRGREALAVGVLLSAPGRAQAVGSREIGRACQHHSTQTSGRILPIFHICVRRRTPGNGTGGFERCGHERISY
jgi:hypothetical protein